MGNQVSHRVSVISKNENKNNKSKTFLETPIIRVLTILNIGAHASGTRKCTTEQLKGEINSTKDTFLRV